MENHTEYVLYELVEGYFRLRKNDVDYWEISFPITWNVGYGFEGLNVENGARYRLENKGMFWWRRLTMFEDAVEVGVFKDGKCLKPNPDIWLDGRKQIFKGSE